MPRKGEPLRGVLGVATLAVALGGCVGIQRAALERADGPGGGAHYHVRVDESLSTLWAEVCFAGEPPGALVPLGSEASDALVQVYDSQGVDVPLPADRDRIPLDRFGPGDCLHYEVDLLAANRASRMTLRRRGDLLITQALWIWAPSQRPDTARFSVDFDLPQGMYVSVPWARDDDRYVLDESTFRTAGNTVFTFQRPRRFERAGVDIEIARLPGPLTVGGASLETWIGAAVDAVTGLYGSFPRARLHVVVVPAGPGLRPVAFGLVRRGGGASVMLLVHEDASVDDLVPDWTVIHELTHLTMPLMKSEDAWMSEGVATYLQEVLRVRAGLLSEEEGWANILDGFRRGARVGTDRGLADEARDMRQTGAYRRVYWAGAAFALEADVLLRSEAGVGLDQMISRSQGAWPRRPTWQGRAVMHRFDRLAKASLLVPLADRYAEAQEFPDMQRLLARLGVSKHGDKVVLDDDAPLAHVRRAIMAPLPPSPHDRDRPRRK